MEVLYPFICHFQPLPSHVLLPEKHPYSDGLLDNEVIVLSTTIGRTGTCVFLSKMFGSAAYVEALPLGF